VTVNFATANGTATAGSDYTAASGTLSFAANELQKTFNVPITDDTAVESNETVSLTLSSPTGTAVLGSPSSATLTIQDNDGTTPPSSSNSNLRISQIYTRGGEAGATYQNDFVEVFNAGSTAVDINGWAMVVITFEGTTQQAIGSRFNSSYLVPPGMHLLFRFNGNGTAGQPVPGEFPIITDISLGSTSGQIMLLSPSQTLPTGCPTSFGLNGTVADFVGYGTSACFEGAPAPVPPANQSLTRIGGGCTDTDNNANDFALQAPNPRISTSPFTPCGSTAPTTPVLNFSATQYTVGENAGNATITVIRSGVVNVPVTVNFATANGTATAGSDYTAASGTLSFAANELQKTFNVPITDDTAVESNETVSLTLSSPTGTAVLGSPSTATLTIQDNDGTTPPPSSNSNLRISQVYTRGGEAGATYQNDFVEVFNAGSTAVNINGWAMVVITFEGATQQAIGSRFNSNFSMPPGMHLLFRFKGNGTAGQAVPGEYPIINDISLGSTSGQIMLLSPTQALPAGCPTSFGVNGAVTDFVGYGTSTCFEGAPAPVPPSNKSLTRMGGGCTDTDNNASDFPLADPNPRISSSPVTPCGSSTSQATVVSFSIGDPGSFPIIDATNFAIVNKTSAFVDQHYHDFLSRFPDASGLQFWVNNIESCGSDVQCREVKRIDTSASFFLSNEFQQTGYLVERFYKVGYGDGTGTSTFGGQHQLPVPIVRMSEFLNDTQRIGRGVVVLASGWEQQLASNKQAYAQEFVQATRFTTAFPTTMTPAQFVDKLNLNGGNVLSATERTTAINLFGGAADSSNVTARAQVVRQVAEDTDLYNAEYNRGFVMAEYFGYLRRNPNEGPDNDFTGYDFWLTKLNQFGGDYRRAEMVKAFISSIEYSNRVGQ
ncbi:MAG TPA: Calx-beta domain-containing protein, partial [Pyrinomonadaceae bacterium]|nr:Calx-beta domain-containing protein [Pyrinomonadaceae bacterium]